MPCGRCRPPEFVSANPPFGVEWKPDQDFIEKEHETQGYDGRFGAGLPRINDGSLQMDNKPVKSFRSLALLAQHLQHLRQPREPEAWGYFHNRDQRFGQIVRMALEHPRRVNDLQTRGEAAFIQLCRLLKVDPDHFRDRPLSERLGFGNAALSVRTTKKG